MSAHNDGKSESVRRVKAALDFSGPDRLPRDMWDTRVISTYRPVDWRALLYRFPMDIDRPPSVLGPSNRVAGGAKGDPGTRVDDWGNVWTSLGVGAAGEVTGPALRDWSRLASFTLPWEQMRHHQTEAVNAFCGRSRLFTLGEIGPGPFERMQALRGAANLLMDIGEESHEFFKLLALVHEFFRQHVALWCRTDVDAIAMGDDWGTQAALLISPRQWRRLFRPLYAEYFDAMHRAGKRVFFHSDGMIREIIPDLIDIGVEALNSQIFCMDIEEIGRSFRGRVAFWGEIDRQQVLPFGTPEDVRRAARRVRTAFGGEEGGLIAQLSWGIDVPLENVTSAFEEWNR